MPQLSHQQILKNKIAHTRMTFQNMYMRHTVQAHIFMQNTTN